MNLFTAKQEEIQREISAYLTSVGVENPSVDLIRPAFIAHGDISNHAALKYAKTLQKSPIFIAAEIVKYLLEKQIKHIENIIVVKPGYINIFFDQSFFNIVIEEVLREKSNFGSNEILKGEKWIVEHTSPNPNKAMHLGHLRNNLVGMSIINVLSRNGATVVSDAVDNNRGIAIAKMMWGFLSHMKKESTTPVDITYWGQHREEWLTPSDVQLPEDVFVTKCYTLGETDFKADPQVEKSVRKFVVDWELNDRDTRELWSHVLSYAYLGINKTLARLGNRWDTVWHEHEHYQKGKDFVSMGLSKKIFTQLEDGAVLTNLSRYELPDTILLKNDGTSLYITQDIALTALKKEHYNADKLLWVIGPEQALAMRQLFAICEQLGIGNLGDFMHVPYGYVGLKGEDGGFKKMSSREGTVVLIDDVIDAAKQKILERFCLDGREESDILREQSEKMAIAAVKFSLLKSDRAQELIFDLDQSIETSGDSGIYVLYVYVRIASMLRKSEAECLSKINFPASLGSEAQVVKLLMYFPSVVQKSMEDLSAHHIAQYLLEICSAFNSWYAKEVILDGSEQQGYKLAVASAVGVIIKNGLEILGIKTIEKI